MSLTCQVQIALNNISGQEAETVKKALEPDNVDFPEGLGLVVNRVDDRLVFSFQSENGMRQLVSTIDEVLDHVQVALRVIQ